MTDKRFRIALAGAGVVGAALARLIETKQDFLLKKSGAKVQITDIAMRDQARDRGFSQAGMTIWNDALEMVKGADVDLIIELIGGEDGIALDMAKASLARGINFITANKAMLAHHAPDLAKLAESHDCHIAYEAAVAGGIPIIKALKEGLVANEFNHIYGILNGTSNYILTAMKEQGWDFATALKITQEKGYAEADPSFDINGTDAAHKLALLTSLAFGVWPEFNQISITGIENVDALDHQYADELGMKIKLLGEAMQQDDKILQLVEPVLVHKNAPIAAIDGVVNGIVCVGDYVGDSLYEGAGAGGEATASAVMGDVMDMACKRFSPMLGMKSKDLKTINPGVADAIIAPFYIRLSVYDRSGVLADITAILKQYQISVETIMQHGHETGKPVDLVMLTHSSQTGDVQKAISRINQLDSIVKNPQIMRIMR